MLLAAAVFAAPLGWLSTLIKTAKAQQRVVAMVERLGGTVGYDNEFDESGHWLDEPRDPQQGFREAVGRDYFDRLIYIDLSDSATRDAELQCLDGVAHLQVLVLGMTEISDKGLKELSELSELRELYLLADKVTGAGLEHLARLHNLRVLDLRETQVRDEDLIRLAALTELRVLKLTAAKITDEGIAKLHAALPDCQIVR
ncbi:MAG TPA: hypothetical protein VMV10_17285 [Pirellulales bacterium]|nr:hypothetical protein [Pirellulales bacterium]